MMGAAAAAGAAARVAEVGRRRGGEGRRADAARLPAARPTCSRRSR